MSEVYTADWYDTVMVEDGSPAMLPLEESPWLEVYEALAGLVKPHEEIVDLGCGTGRFIELLQRKGHYAQITGIDWSGAALAEAARYLGGNSQPALLHLQDLAEWKPDPQRAGNTVYVCSEVLEHLDDDLALVRAIPPGHRLLFTVPNFDSQAHLRTFYGPGDVWRRYDPLLEFCSWRLIGPERHAIHVCETIRRADAW